MKNSGWVLCSLVLGVFSVNAFAGPVNCYHDDSFDFINQDILRTTPWGTLLPLPDPLDCNLSPAITVNRDGEVLVSGKRIYTNTIDPAIDVRGTPAGVVALLTEDRDLYRYDPQNGLKLWYSAGYGPLKDYRISRNGSMMAINTSDELIVDGKIPYLVSGVERLYASASGLIVALMKDGEVRSASQVLYASAVDPAVRVKVSENGVVAWMTKEGRIGSSVNAKLHRDTVDPALAFKVSTSGHVAYLLQSGRLARDGRYLWNSKVTGIVEFSILASGEVVAKDSDGEAHYFP